MGVGAGEGEEEGGEEKAEGGEGGEEEVLTMEEECTARAVAKVREKKDSHAAKTLNSKTSKLKYGVFESSSNSSTLNTPRRRFSVAQARG